MEARAVNGWALVYEGFEPRQEGLREALCTLGNGYFATRGAAVHARADDVHYPGTYLAGGYNRLTTEIAGRAVENEDLVNLPNWLSLTFRIDGGEWFDLRTVALREYRQTLDLRQGVLERALLFQDRNGRRTRLAERRLVHMDEPHLAALELTLTPENWSGTLEVRTALDGRVVNAGVARYRDLNQRHLEALEAEPLDDEILYLKVRTSQSRIEIAQATRTRLYRGDTRLTVAPRIEHEAGCVAHRFALDLSVTVPATRETTISDPMTISQPSSRIRFITKLRGSIGAP